MASTLLPYKTAAKNRDVKIHRAIDSVLKQSFEDFELYIIADGCEKTFQVAEKYKSDERVRCSLISKQPTLSGNVRNFGIAHAKGDWITYCDIDDELGQNHLKIINDEINKITPEPEWVFYNAYTWSRNRFVEQNINIYLKNNHGTCNFTHRKSLNVLWKTSGYDHDYFFCNELKQYKNFVKIKTPEYYVMHIPGNGGYDI